MTLERQQGPRPPRVRGRDSRRRCSRHARSSWRRTSSITTRCPGSRPAPTGAEYVVTTMHGAHPDLRFAIDDLIAEGDRVTIRWTLRGTNTGPLARPAADRSAGRAVGDRDLPHRRRPAHGALGGLEADASGRAGCLATRQRDAEGRAHARHALEPRRCRRAPARWRPRSRGRGPRRRGRASARGRRGRSARRRGRRARRRGRGLRPRPRARRSRPSRRTRTTAAASAGVCARTFASRLSTTWRRRSASPVTVTAARRARARAGGRAPSHGRRRPPRRRAPSRSTGPASSGRPWSSRASSSRSLTSRPMRRVSRWMPVIERSRSSGRSRAPRSNSSA